MKWLSPDEVAEDPRLPIKTGDWVRAQLRKGKLNGTKLAGRWVVAIKEDPSDTTVADAIDEMFANASNEARRRKARAA